MVATMSATCACFVAWLCSTVNHFNVVNAQPKINFTSTRHVRALNPNKFPGVTLRELVDVEDVFEINVVVYALEVDDQSPKATVVQLSRKKYERTMYVNLHESHFSYIFDVSKYCQRYEFQGCSEFWTSKHFHYHLRTCDAQVKHIYVGDVHNNKKTVFDQLEQLGIYVPHEDRFYPYRSTFDYEIYFDKSDLPDAGEKSVWVARHVPCSVSVCSNVPNFEKPKCFINASPQRLVHDKMQYLETIADAAFEILKEYVFDQLEPKKQAASSRERTIRLVPARAHCYRHQLVLLRHSTGESASAGIPAGQNQVCYPEGQEFHVPGHHQAEISGH